TRRTSARSSTQGSTRKAVVLRPCGGSAASTSRPRPCQGWGPAMRRPLFLSGFMATGKSTVGQKLAERTGRRFIDRDARLATRLGTTIAEYFARAGEASFRAEEQAELRRVLAEPYGDAAPVVALGGGALLARDLRLEVLDAAVVVTLKASAAEVARRAGGRSGRPLLDTPDPERRALELLAQRALAYAEAHATVSTDGRTP